MEKTLDFWFEFASPYSYPAAMRVAQLAEQVGVTVRWRVFLLGAVFQQYGWQTTPDKIFHAMACWLHEFVPYMPMSLGCQNLCVLYIRLILLKIKILAALT